MVNYNEKLKAYEYFQECIILGVEWKNLGLTIDFIFDYIWDKNGKVNKNENKVIIRFNIIQELHIIRNLNKINVQSPEEVTWGINEISHIKIEDNEEILSRYSNLPRQFHHAVMHWENDQRIEVVFAEMEILPSLNIVS